MNVPKIESVDFNTVHKVLTSRKLTETQKTKFIKNHSVEIRQLVNMHITSTEYKGLMKNRPLQKFRPLKNSFTKRGDKILLAKALELPVGDVEEYIENVSSALENTDNLTFLSPDKVDLIKTYVYRHGSKQQLVNFLDYELKTAKDKIKVLYNTLEYHTGGVADYFIRPIHRMDNKTLVHIYNVVDKNLHECEATGLISEVDNRRISEWALYRIYEIQNNSKFINAIKTYKVLSQ